MAEPKNKSSEQPSSISRRQFLGGTAAATAAFTIIPRHVLGGPGFKPPSDTVNIAVIGAGGKGRSDSYSVGKTENIVAMCDVDDSKMAETLRKVKEEKDLEKLAIQMEKAPKYKDFRVMLEKEKSIDAVTVSTPDHTHAVAAAMAMRMGKHCFVQKPLTHSVKEARILRQIAKEANVTTQMGNQGHAGEGGRLVCEWIWAGVIGDVREVHCWTNRPVWKTGMDRPKEIPSVRPSLDWNLWIGPAPWRSYHPAYAPWSWRAWCDFGTGALGDMGAHIFDHAYWPMKLEYPTKVHAFSTKFNNESWPVAETFYYEFPARGDMPPVKLTWHDGGMAPPRPDDIEQGRKLGNNDGGVLFIGDKGKIMCGCYGQNPRIIPETKMKEATLPPKTIPRSPGIHEEWVEAIKKGEKSTTDIEYSSKLVETMMIGNIAIRMAHKNTVLEWDGEKGEFTNMPEANEYLIRDYREGWSL
jgi:predicted dehydrogenase